MIHPPFTNVALWIGIAFCIVQTGIFSGLNLALFSVSRLRLEIEAAGGNGDAVKMLSLRADSNFTLATILWGNVATNVLLTLLSESVLAGVGAFVFSTVAITFLGEIIPQAYFSRNALRIAARFAPFLRFYQVMLFAVAKPTALFLNWWLGPESIALLRERDFRALLSNTWKPKAPMSEDWKRPAHSTFSTSTISPCWRRGSQLTPGASSPCQL
jgi:CBS domain containing-hemolysin-like protein